MLIYIVDIGFISFHVDTFGTGYAGWRLFLKYEMISDSSTEKAETAGFSDTSVHVCKNTRHHFYENPTRRILIFVQQQACLSGSDCHRVLAVSIVSEIPVVEDSGLHRI